MFRIIHKMFPRKMKRLKYLKTTVSLVVLFLLVFTMVYMGPGVANGPEDGVPLREMSYSRSPVQPRLLQENYTTAIPTGTRVDKIFR